MSEQDWSLFSARNLDDDVIADQVIALSADETKLEIVPEQKQETVEEPSQVALFEKGEWWEEAWRGMPEFVQKDFMPYKTVMVHFENRQDMEAFASLVQQNILLTTKSIWYPEAQLAEVAKLRWISKSEKSNSKKEELQEIMDSE